MEEMREIIKEKTLVSEDRNSISLYARKYVLIGNKKYYSDTFERKCFFKAREHEDTGEWVKNPDFHKQIDEWTGVKDFIKTHYNV